MNEVRNIAFTAEPPYDKLIEILVNCMKENNIDPEQANFDWIV